MLPWNANVFRQVGSFIRRCESVLGLLSNSLFYRLFAMQACSFFVMLDLASRIIDW